MGTVQIPKQELEQLKTTVKQLKGEKKELKKDMKILRKEAEKFRRAAEEGGEWGNYEEATKEEKIKILRDCAGGNRSSPVTAREVVNKMEDEIKVIVPKKLKGSL